MAKISIDLNSGTIQKESAVIGIDLGTTNSLIATINSKTQKPYCVTKNGNRSLSLSISTNKFADGVARMLIGIGNKDKSLLASKIVVDVLKRQSSNKGTLIKYGKNEEALLKYLEDNDRITLQQFRKMVNISKWRASKILVNLISAGVILNHTHEKTEFYTLV